MQSTLEEEMREGMMIWTGQKPTGLSTSERTIEVEKQWQEPQVNYKVQVTGKGGCHIFPIPFLPPYPFSMFPIPCLPHNTLHFTFVAAVLLLTIPFCPFRQSCLSNSFPSVTLPLSTSLATLGSYAYPILSHIFPSLMSSSPPFCNTVEYVILHNEN